MGLKFLNGVKLYVGQKGAKKRWREGRILKFIRFFFNLFDFIYKECVCYCVMVYKKIKFLNNFRFSLILVLLAFDDLKILLRTKNSTKKIFFILTIAIMNLELIEGQIRSPFYYIFLFKKKSHQNFLGIPKSL